MNKESFGYPLTNERQYIIFILIPYLICKTKIVYMQIGLSIVLCIHLYKYYHNNRLNKSIYQGKSMNIYNLLLFLSLLMFIKNNDNYIAFCLLFIITGILFRRLSHNLYKYKDIKNNSDILFIIILTLSVLFYPNYQFNYILIMEIINHLIILKEKH